MKRHRRRRPAYRIRRAIRRMERLLDVQLSTGKVGDRLIAKSELVETLISKYYPNRDFADVYQDALDRKL